MKAALSLLLAITGLAAPQVRPILWSEVPHVLKQWKAVNPSGTAAWANTGSMMPGIMPSDLLLCEAYIGQPLTGEIAVYYFSAKYPDVSHECLKETRFRFLPKGTNNDPTDGWQDKSHVKWVVVAVLRPGY